MGIRQYDDACFLYASPLVYLSNESNLEGTHRDGLHHIFVLLQPFDGESTPVAEDMGNP